MGFLGRLKTFAIATAVHPRGRTHEERLQEYYRHQADGYDEFRERLLHGRRELLDALPLQNGDKVIELGGGTGFSLDALGDRLALCQQYVIVDLCHALFTKAVERVERNRWTNVSVIHGDATTCDPLNGPADVVIFSYCLTMMPNWFQIVDHAWRLLRPGGLCAVADFYISAPHVATGMRQHRTWQRWFWPLCFGWHNVHLSPDHLPYLQSRFETLHLTEKLGRMPFMAGLQAPYYVFVGRKATSPPPAPLELAAIRNSSH